MHTYYQKYDKNFLDRLMAVACIVSEPNWEALKWKEACFQTLWRSPHKISAPMLCLNIFRILTADHFLILVYSTFLTSEGKANSIVSSQVELEKSDFNVLAPYIIEQQTPKSIHHFFNFVNNCAIYFFNMYCTWLSSLISWLGWVGWACDGTTPGCRNDVGCQSKFVVHCSC